MGTVVFQHESPEERLREVTRAIAEAWEPAFNAAVAIGWRPELDIVARVTGIGLNQTLTLVVGGVAVFEVTTKLERDDAGPVVRIASRKLARIPLRSV